MATQIPHPITYNYKETHLGKFKTVKRYELVTVNTKNPKLSNIIRISKDQLFAKSSPVYWLDGHNGKKFVKPSITGLFKTSKGYIYYGDIDINRVKTHTLIFVFSRNAETLTIKFFENFYTKDIDSLFKFL